MNIQQDTKLSDYITTDTVMQALGDASNIARAGAVEAVNYIRMDAIISVVVAMMLIIMLAIIAVAVSRFIKPLFRDDGDYCAACFGILFCYLLLLFVLCLVIADNLPRAIEPIGALIYTVLKS